jgi:23S rRNA (adenine1618-N6)-methyltransferase
MIQKRKEHPKEKARLHPRNKHRERYDFKQLVESCPELAQFVKMNIYNDESVDFADPEAVLMLNKALLKHFYNIDFWDIPRNYLCPPIPGRADYLHHIADVLGSKNFGKIPMGESIKCLDIGVGANCVYPLIGNSAYGWSFVGSDIDTFSLESAQKIVDSNPGLEGKIELRFQKNPGDVFFGVIQKDEQFDLSICNPPFHSSKEEAQSGTLRKLSNLKQEKVTEPALNFGGQNNELWCKGGEEKFLSDMIRESEKFSTSCFWYSSLVAKQSHLKRVLDLLQKAKAAEVKTIPMGQGNKSSRIVAWTFLTPEQQLNWVSSRWKDAT